MKAPDGDDVLIYGTDGVQMKPAAYMPASQVPMLMNDLRLFLAGAKVIEEERSGQNQGTEAAG